ncbi:putative membrane protein [[Clostridium] sordellii ATCC 9714]|nr:putative membrane protein [[Clostridium] sordellii ATCC 9714] [Paeniclostridium sordellii ATCC 9714]
MGIPESIVIFSSISIIINSINRRSIITMSSIYLILMYLLKNYVSSGIGNLLVFISVAVLVKLHSKAKITQCFVVTSIILAIKMATEMMTIFCINFTGINLNIYWNIAV